eukprot:5468388-Pleurochrysis_carterae.AAC.2
MRMHSSMRGNTGSTPTYPSSSKTCATNCAPFKASPTICDGDEERSYVLVHDYVSAFSLWS